MANSSFLPPIKMAEIPEVVYVGDLHENGKLMSDEQINLLMVQNKPDGRYKKQALNTPYDISYLNGEPYAIYSGVLGKGGFGAVKVAQNLKSGVCVVDKIIKKKLEWAPQEIEILKSVNQQIGSYLRKNKTNELQFEIFMPLAPGVELYRLIEENRELSAIEYIQIFNKLLDECDKLLQQGIVHRDIKDANVVIELARFILTVVDFGLAREMNSPQGYRSVEAVGTKECAAPEILRHDGINEVLYDEKTEIYALAITMARLLRLVYDEKSNTFCYEKKANYSTFQRKIPQKSTQEKIINLLNSMVHVSADQRPTMKAVMKEIKNIQAELNDVSRIISVGCVDINEYILADEEHRMKLMDFLSKMDRVCLVDNSGRHQASYNWYKKIFQELGTDVFEHVVQYRERNGDMPGAINAYLNNQAPHAGTRYYTGFYFMGAANKNNYQLQRLLNENGITRFMMGGNGYSAADLIKYSRIIDPSFINKCVGVVAEEYERLSQKQALKKSENRQQKMAKLAQANDDFKNIAKEGLVRNSVFCNTLSRLSVAMKEHVPSKTTDRLSDLGKMFEYRISSELVENRAKIKVVL